jgi:hypothetical protein
MRGEVRSFTAYGVTAARELYLKSRLALLCSFIICVLSACSYSGSDDIHHGPAPPPADAAQKIETIQTLPSPMETFRALAPPEGLKFTPLFNEPVKDTDARIKRLEDAVQGVRNDFDTVVPSLVRLVAVEKDMKELVKQLQTLTDTSAASQPPALPVEPLPVPEKNSADSGKKIPGEDVAGGTETAGIEKKAGLKASSSLVTPEAAPEGELPPEGAASPNSKTGAAAPDSKAGAAAPPVAKTPPPKVAAPEAVAPAKPDVVMPAKPAEALPVAPTPAAKTAAPVTGSKVRDVRVGDHKDKTRIVLDLTAKADYAVSIENKGTTLVIDMAQADWSAIKPFDADVAALVSGWHVDGHRLVLDLLYPATIKDKQMLHPNGTPDYRLVVDLFSKDVHK